MSKMKPLKSDHCPFCNLAFISLKDIDEAKMTKAGWAHAFCIERVLRKEAQRKGHAA